LIESLNIFIKTKLRSMMYNMHKQSKLKRSLSFNYFLLNTHF